MSTADINDLASGLLDRARESSAQRAADTVYGGSDHRLRQTLIALTAGNVLSEHESPGEATLHVLRGCVELRAGDESTVVAAGQLAAIPDERHSLTASDDSVVLLTVAKH